MCFLQTHFFHFIYPSNGPDWVLKYKIENWLRNVSVVLFRGTILERQKNTVGHAEPGSVALPGIMRAGGPGRLPRWDERGGL